MSGLKDGLGTVGVAVVFLYVVFLLLIMMGIATILIIFIARELFGG